MQVKLTILETNELSFDLEGSERSAHVRVFFASGSINQRQMAHRKHRPKNYLLGFDNDFSLLLSLLLRYEKIVSPSTPLVRLLPLAGSFRPGSTSEVFE